MLPSVIDTHAHLDMSHFDADREDVIRRAKDAGIANIITVGIDLPSSRKAIQLAESYALLQATVGFHPQEAAKMQPGDTGELARLAENKLVVGIGEIGLDYYRMKAPREVQVQALKQQLDVATRLELPVVIHCRQAEQDMLPVLQIWTTATVKKAYSPGVVHCFNSNVNVLKSYLDMGFYVAFGAYTGYPSSKMAEVVKAVPSEKLLVETDSPFLPPQTHRGKRNEPAYVTVTVGVLAQIRRVSFEDIARQTTENARQLFRIRN